MGKKSDVRKDDAQAIFALAIFGFIALTLCGVLVIPYYLYLKGLYVSSTARRINDFNKFSTASVKAIFTLAFPTIIAANVAILLSESAEKQTLELVQLILLMPVFISWIWLVVFVGRWLAVVHLGIIVDPGKDRVIFPVDQESYDLLDYLTLKFIRDLPKLDEIKISDVRQITRQSGLNLYLMCDFESRRISFSNKQKRDECIYALTSSGLTNAKVVKEFESA